MLHFATERRPGSSSAAKWASRARKRLPRSCASLPLRLARFVPGRNPVGSAQLASQLAPSLRGPLAAKRRSQRKFSESCRPCRRHEVIRLSSACSRTAQMSSKHAQSPVKMRWRISAEMKLMIAILLVRRLKNAVPEKKPRLTEILLLQQKMPVYNDKFRPACSFACKVAFKSIYLHMPTWLEFVADQGAQQTQGRSFDTMRRLFLTALVFLSAPSCVFADRTPLLTVDGPWKFCLVNEAAPAAACPAFKDPLSSPLSFYELTVCK